MNGNTRNDAVRCRHLLTSFLVVYTVIMDTDSNDGSSGSNSSYDTPNVGNTKASSLPTNTQLFHRVRLSQQQDSLPLSKIQKNLSIPTEKQKDGDVESHPPLTEPNRILNLGLSQQQSTLCNRFRSLSNYSYFQPQALDCFTSLSCSSNDSPPYYTSIGAMASTQSGIVLIPMASKPYEPLLILRHCIPHTWNHTSSPAPKNYISCLKFQPSSCNLVTSPTFLASASSHSPSLLIWDISGQCMNPLVGRLDAPMDTSYSFTRNTYTPWEDPFITSIAWTRSGDGILASGRDCISMWDLRCTHGGMSSISNRPNQRWGTTTPSGINHSRRSFNSVVTSKQSEEHWIATLDSLGVVRFFDDRISRKDDGGGCTHSFVSHSKVGAGMEYFVSAKNKRNTFMIWGLDENQNSSVKVWQQNKDNITVVDDNPCLEPHSLRDFECISNIQHKSLLCARVCPVTDVDSIVTIHSEDNTWSASAWTLNDKSIEGSPFYTSNDFGADLVASFGGSNENMIPQVLQDESINLDTLIAAELTLGVFPDRSYADCDAHRETEILLCCLTAKGYLSTHAITEFSTLSHTVDPSVVQRPVSFPTKLDYSVPSSILPPSIKGEIHEHFTHEQKTTTEGETIEPVRLDPDRHARVQDLQWLEDDIFLGIPGSLSSDNSMKAGFYNVEGVSLHFEYDRNSADLLTSSAGEDTGHIITAVPNPSLSSPTIDPYKASRVPSPRLCGAVFTLEKLAVFTNGPVMNKWSWFVTDQIYKNQSCSTRVDQLDEFQEVKTFKYLQNDANMVDNNELLRCYDHKEVLIAQSPHTFWDFCRMKEAIESLHLNNVCFSEGGNVIDDLSDTDASILDREKDCTSWSSDQEDESSVDTTELSSTNVFESQLNNGSAKMAMINLSELKRSRLPRRLRPTKAATRTMSRQIDGEVNHDFVTPNVFVATRNIALCRQSSKLAELWQLGAWEARYSDIFETEVTSLRPSINVASTQTKQKENSQNNLYVESDKNLSLKRNGSMIVNLKTVISQKGNSLTSIPSDQRFMQKGRQLDVEESQSWQDSSHHLSLHPLTLELKPSGYIYRHYQQVQDICIHNAKVSRFLGYPEKDDIWKMLALIVDNVLNGEYDNFDGWNGLGGGSIGAGLISKILKLLEIQGDVQMLATIVCVFCGGRNTHEKAKTASTGILRNNLLIDEDAKFDNYISLYSSILYRWGLLGLRTELNKHIAARELLPCHANTDNIIQNLNSFQDMQCIPICYKCSKPADAETNICKDCKDFAFRCAVCMNPVRGLFLVCNACTC